MAESTIYNFDVTSQTIYMTVSGTWATSSEGYYYAVIPLEVGKVYKVTLQNITTLSRFRCSQSDSNVIGEGELSFIAYTDEPANDYYISFVAEKSYLICYGGTANGGEVSVMSPSITSLIGTKWKMYSDAKWLTPSTWSFFQIDGIFYEGENQLTPLSADNNIFVQKNNFGYGSTLNSASWNIYPSPMVDDAYANERWRVVTGYFVGSGLQMRDLTDTLYLEITGGQDAENPALIAWVYGAGELQEDIPKTLITYNGSTIASLEAGQSATLSCQGKKMKSDIVVSAEAEEDDSIVGTWYFNDDISMLASSGSEYVDLSYTFTKDNNVFQSKQIATNASNKTLWFYYYASDTATALTNMLVWNNGVWQGENYRTITITSYDDTTMSEQDFLTWLKANATKQSSADSSNTTTVTYDNETIATLEAGQTATLKCEGKKMKSDVIVAVKSAEEESIVGTWRFNDTITAPFNIPNANSYTAYASYGFDVPFTLNAGDATSEKYGIRFSSGMLSGYYYKRLQFASIAGLGSSSVWGNYYAFNDNAWQISVGSSPITISIPENAIVTNYESSSDYTLPDFYTWLKANATKVS